MEKLIFNYLNKTTVEVNAPKSLVYRIQNCIENNPNNNPNHQSLLSIKEIIPYNTIIKDNSYPYSSFSNNYTKSYPGWDYYRYGTKTKTIWKLNNYDYKVLNYLAYDESTSLICLRNCIYNCPSLKTTLMVHGSLISLNNTGILISGDSRSGKTSLMLYFLEKYGADFISDESVLLSFENNSLIGYYVPKTIRVRFSNIVNSPLDYLISNYKEADATQDMDADAIQNIISKKAFHVNAGLAISRKQLIKSYGVYSQSEVKIERIIFPEYKNINIPILNQIKKVDALLKLEAQLREKKRTINPCNLKHYKSKINQIWLSNILTESLQFNDQKSLKYVQF